MANIRACVATVATKRRQEINPVIFFIILCILYAVNAITAFLDTHFCSLLIYFFGSIERHVPMYMCKYTMTIRIIYWPTLFRFAKRQKLERVGASSIQQRFRG